MIQLVAKDDSVQKLRMKIFLPERSGIQESTTILLRVNEIKQPSPVLSAGEKEIYLECFERNHEYMTLGLSTDDPFDCKPGMDRRRLMAVLLDLSHVHIQGSGPQSIAV